jgi:hypothetical protein
MLMIKSAKQLKIDFFLNSYYTYPHIEFKHDFGPKKYKFWLCVFNKSCSFLCDGVHDISSMQDRMLIK